MILSRVRNERTNRPKQPAARALLVAVVAGWLVCTPLLLGWEPPSASSRSQADVQGNNISALREFKHPVPALEEWWIAPPTPDQFVSAIIEPAVQKQGAICIKRLWIPRKIRLGKNVDERLIKSFASRPLGPQQLALAAHFAEAAGNSRAAKDLMDAAREQFFTEPWKGTVYFPFRSAKMVSAILSLDWISWKSPDEFERAFETAHRQVQLLLDQTTANSTTLAEEGYWFAGHACNSGYFGEELLAIVAFGVNKSGKSHAWARERLMHLGTDLQSDPQSLYSTFEYANTLSLLSRRGGGREFGQDERKPGLGGYEAYYLLGAVIQLEAIDTATGRKWDLRRRCLYTRTRQIGLVLEEDQAVLKTDLPPTSIACIAILAKLFRDDAEIGGRYQWINRNSKKVPYLMELQALAGPAPAAKPPQPVAQADRVGSRWHYRRDPSQPNDTLRCWIVNRDIENFRVSPDERCLYLAVGNVGLVDGHCNRCYTTGALANGVALTVRNENGEPYVAGPDFWPALACHHPYWSPKRALDAKPVLEDPFFLVGTDGPTQIDGKWHWTRDYTAEITQENKSPITGKIKLAKFEFEFDPKLKRMEVVDTIRAEESVYVGWHFSPSHAVKLLDNGFRFGDGKDEIRVTVQGLDGTELQVQRRHEWVHDTYTLPLDWHEKMGGPKRIAENVGYTPTTYQDEYRVRVIIQANR